MAIEAVSDDGAAGVSTNYSPIVCRNCALLLARIVYQRHWWFPLLREPLLMGMRILAWRHRIDARRHKVRNPSCNGCIRYMKAELEEKSPTFRFLNARIGDHFSRLRNASLTGAELAEAKRFANEAMAGEEEDRGNRIITMTDHHAFHAGNLRL